MSASIRRLFYATNGIAAAAASRGQIVCYDTIAFAIVLSVAVSFIVNICLHGNIEACSLECDPVTGLTLSVVRLQLIKLRRDKAKYRIVSYRIVSYIRILHKCSRKCSF